MKLQKLASLVNGEIIGNASLEIRGVSTFEDAQTSDLIFLLEARNLESAQKSKALAVVAQNPVSGKTTLQVKNPRLAFAKILPQIIPQKKKTKKHKTAIIGKKVKLGKNVSLGAYVVIGDNVSIGDDTILYPNVTIYDDTKIGKRVILHAGAVIGVDGYGYAQDGKTHVKIPQIGNVIIEDDVEIYANTCIARGTLSPTIIKKGTKIDDLCHIAHNCQIGENCAITALVGFAGSVTFGNNVYVGGMAGFNDHIHIGDNTLVMGKAVVTKNTAPNSIVSGFYAMDHKADLELHAYYKKLPELFKRLAELEKK